MYSVLLVIFFTTRRAIPAASLYPHIPFMCFTKTWEGSEGPASSPGEEGRNTQVEVEHQLLPCQNRQLQTAAACGHTYRFGIKSQTCAYCKNSDEIARTVAELWTHPV